MRPSGNQPPKQTVSTPFGLGLTPNDHVTENTVATAGQADEGVFIINYLLNVKKFNRPGLLGPLLSLLPSLTALEVHAISLP